MAFTLMVLSDNFIGILDYFRIILPKLEILPGFENRTGF